MNDEGARSPVRDAGAPKMPSAAFPLEGAPVVFYVVRHGQTLFNVMGKVQGWCDTPLTDEGIRGAEALGRGLAGMDFAAAFSSDSGRAVQTLDVLLAAWAAARGEEHASGGPFLPKSGSLPFANLSFPLAQDPRLREWCYGDLEGEPGELLHAALTAGFGEELSFREHNCRLPEVADVLARADTSGRAECFECIEGRLNSFFAEAGEAVRLAGGGNALVVTHSFVVRTLVYLLDSARVNDPAKIPNASITRIGYDGGHFSLGEIGSTSWQA
ncbi:MAG: histidine phosphatase family protein [Gordonibacter sp.]